MGIRADRDFYVIIDRHISWDWKHYEYFFIIAFAAAALLFLARGIRTIGEDKSHLAGGILYLIGATFMVSFLTASILTILGGSL